MADADHPKTLIQRNNKLLNEELIDSLMDGSPEEIIASFKKIDALVDDALRLVIRLLENDEKLLNKCRYRIQIVPWSRRKVRMEHDNPSGHQLIKNRYQQLSSRKTIDGKPNSDKRTLHKMSLEFDMKVRKLQYILKDDQKIEIAPN